jgi:predicted P-loop ATPase/GTPase
MTKNILIIGLKNNNSGKTSLTRAIISQLKDNGYETCGFKPFSGNNIWYDFDIIDKTLSEGRIYSKDALLLKKESTLNANEESLNPIHRIWNEPANINPITHLPNFIIDRITLKKRLKNEHLLIINQKNLKQIPVKYLNKIFEKSHEKHTITKIETLNKLIQKYYKKALETNYQSIKKKCDYIIIESYPDQALLKWHGLNNLNKVLETMADFHLRSYKI